VGSVEPPTMGRQFTILIVEDDREVRDVVAQTLSARNFKVLTANDGYQAVRLLVDYHVDVMFTDISMPGLSGYELAAQAKLVSPSLRIVYTTGYDGNAAGKEMAARYGKTIQKPIRNADLVGAIEQALKD
jgi:DNA-binding NtrC family response regulator